MEIKHFTSSKTANLIDDMLVVSNYKLSCNEMLNPSIYKIKCKMQGFCLKDNGKLLGGACFYVDEYNWIYVEDLYVDPIVRGNGWGSKLIDEVIDWAKQNGCHGVRLETWDFQARGFYEKHGFVCFGKLEDHPKGQTEFYMAWTNNDHA